MKVNDNIKSIPWDLIQKVLKNAANEDDKNRLNSWVEENEQRRCLWNELHQAWDDILELNSDFNPDTSRAWQQVIEKTKIQYRKQARIIPAHWQVAAACILVLTGVAIGAWFKTTTHFAPTLASYTQYETQYGKSFVTLPDGTQVWLNARTTLKYSNRFNEKERKVELKGEAFFDVAQNPNISFVVETKDMQIKVHGTRFNVQAYDNKPLTSVSLLEGSVSLAVAGYSTTRLEPGYTARYDRKSKKLELNPSDVFVTLWANSELRIEDKSLAETARLLESWYNIKIEVRPALAQVHYYKLTVRHESVAELLTVMQKISKFQYKIEEQRIIIY